MKNSPDRSKNRAVYFFAARQTLQHKLRNEHGTRNVIRSPEHDFFKHLPLFAEQRSGINSLIAKHMCRKIKDGRNSIWKKVDTEQAEIARGKQLLKVLHLAGQTGSRRPVPLGSGTRKLKLPFTIKYPFGCALGQHPVMKRFLCRGRTFQYPEKLNVFCKFSGRLNGMVVHSNW